MIFTRLQQTSRPSSAMALALFVATTGALGIATLAQPALAQEKEQERKAEYSKEFVAAYQPIEKLMAAETSDQTAIKNLIPALVAVTESPDEKRATGGLMLNVGSETGDDALHLRGIKMMLESGILEPTLEGQLNFAAYQAYRDSNDLASARSALEGAIAADYTFDATMTDGSQRTFGADDMRKMIADLYFEQDQYSEGLNYLSGLIEERQASGAEVPEDWIRTGLATAYENDLNADSAKFAAMLAQNYPTEKIWADALIITLNSNQYANPEVLDLLRLSRRVGVYSSPQVLSEYVEVLDPRRYPGEVVAVIDEGYKSGAADQSDPYLKETRSEAEARVAADKADLPSLAAEAGASGADLKTLVVAGDTFLSYDQPAEAEEFYTKALGMTGVETPLVLTRLGIAQYDQGKYAEAVETFKKVEGARRDLANLWAIYAAQKGAM